MNILLQTIDTFKEPYPELDAFNASVRVLTEGLHPTLPNSTEYPVIHQIMSSAFSMDPIERPTFEAIYRMLIREDELDDEPPLRKLSEANKSFRDEYLKSPDFLTQADYNN